MAAAIQAGIGSVAAGSLFATAQSVAMGGAIPMVITAIATSAVGVGITTAKVVGIGAAKAVGARIGTAAAKVAGLGAAKVAATIVHVTGLQTGEASGRTSPDDE